MEPLSQAKAKIKSLKRALNLKRISFLIIVAFLMSGCACGMILSPPPKETPFTFNPPPERNKIFSAYVEGCGDGNNYSPHKILSPLLVIDSILTSAVFIVSWPFRYFIKKDKRLLVFNWTCPLPYQ